MPIWIALLMFGCDVRNAHGLPAWSVVSVEQETLSEPPRREDCVNTVDDDGDGAADCADPDCSEQCAEQCANGLDDDADALIDCDDPECGCLPPPPDEVCTGGVDEDLDGLVDCDDPDCEPECPESCFDGKDNDADGRVDCQDGECLAACTESNCTDGQDDDHDGQADCDDSDCAGTCPVEWVAWVTRPATTVRSGVYDGGPCPDLPWRTAEARRIEGGVRNGDDGWAICPWQIERAAFIGGEPDWRFPRVRHEGRVASPCGFGWGFLPGGHPPARVRRRRWRWIRCPGPRRRVRQLRRPPHRL